MAFTMSTGTSGANYSVIKRGWPGSTSTSTNQPTAPVPTPAPTPAPYVPAPDPIYEGQKNRLATSKNDTDLDIAYDEDRIKKDYGFDDMSNPYNRAKLLQQSYAERQRGTTNSLAARGQLYSGALQNQRDIDQRGFDISDDRLKRDYADALYGIDRRKDSANKAFNEGNLEALSAAGQRELANRPDPLTLDQGTFADLSTPAPAKTLSRAALARRKKRQKAGITDTRGLSAAQIKKLRQQGLLPG